MKNTIDIKNNGFQVATFDKTVSALMITIWTALILFGVIYYCNPYLLLNVTKDERKKEASDNVMIGISLTNQGKFEEALIEYQKALKIYPECHEVYANIGVTYKMFKDYKNANYFLEKAINADSTSQYNIYSNLYDIALEQKNNEKADMYFVLAVKNNPYIIEKSMQIGTGYLNKHKWDSSLAILKNTLKLRFDIKAQYHDMLAYYFNIYVNKPKYRADIKQILSTGIDKLDFTKYDSLSLTNALNSDYELALNYNRIGFCLAKLEKYEQSLPYFKKALKINPTYPCALENVKYVEDILKK